MNDDSDRPLSHTDFERATTLYNVLDSIEIGFFALDPAWRFSYINRFMQRYAEGPIETMIGRSIWETAPELLGTEAEAYYRRAMAERSRVDFQGTCGPFGSLRGTIFDIHIYPTADGLSVFMLDLSERREAEMALRRSEAFRAGLLDAALDAVVMVDSHGAMMEWNPAAERIFGYRRQEVLGRAITELIIPPDFREVYETEMRRYLAAGVETARGNHLQLPAMRRDGSIFPAELSITSIVAGAETQFAIFLRDITERKRADQLLRDSGSQASFLVALNDQTRRLGDPEQIIAASAKLLGTYLGVDRCAYAEVEEDENHFTVNGGYNAPGVSSIVGRYAMSDFGARVLRLMREGLPYVVGDVDKELPEERDLTVYRITGIQAVICVPLHKEGKFSACMAVHMSTPRHWSEGEVELVRMVTERCWESIERARAIRSLHESERQFRTLADSIPQMAWMAQPDGHIFWYNRRWYDYMGSSPEENPEGNWDFAYDPNVVPEMVRRWKVSIATGEMFDMVIPLRGVDGEFRQFLTRMIPVRDDRGEVVRWFGTNTDITDAQRAQQDLRISEARFRTMADGAPVLIWIAGPDRIWSWFNEPWLAFTGRTLEQEQNGRWIDGVHPEDAGRVLSAYEAAFDAREPFSAEFRLRHHSGEYRWILGRGVPLQGDDGTLGGYIGSCIDISDRKGVEQERELLLASERAARAEAERLNRMKDEFLSTVSHELRTPLNAMFGWSELMRMGGLSEEDMRTGLEVIHRNVRIQTQIVEDLLDISRIISGKLRLDVQRVSLPEIINASLESVRPAAEAKGIRLQKIVDPLAGPIAGDPSRLQQIIWNLLSNAVKFTPKGGRVQILLERVNSHIEMSVADTGEGIPPDHLPHIFERFHQADSSTTRRHGGLGLGLAISKSLVEMHGGSIRAKSPGVGAGTTFIVSLPVIPLSLEDDGSQRNHPRGHQPVQIDYEPLSLNGVGVLVVDDDVDGREIVRRVLHESGANVTVASSAPEALRLIELSKPDVIVSDIGMPEMDGYQFIRELRSRSAAEGGAIPALALTAFARSEDRSRAIRAGYQLHLSKPAEPSELVTVIASLTGRL